MHPRTPRPRAAAAALAAAVAAVAAFAVPRDAAASPAVELQGELGPGAQASTWAGDRSAYSSLRLALRLADLVAIDALGRLGYANVDDRMLTYLSLGATLYGRLGRVRPFVRLALVHQHEEPRSAIEADSTGALFGVGNGIRHRAGAGGTLGADVPVWRHASNEMFVGAEATSTTFFDDRGPRLYLGAGVSFGMSFRL
jgi:hypothetical protein